MEWEWEFHQLSGTDMAMSISVFVSNVAGRNICIRVCVRVRVCAWSCAQLVPLH